MMLLYHVVMVGVPHSLLVKLGRMGSASKPCCAAPPRGNNQSSEQFIDRSSWPKQTPETTAKPQHNSGDHSSSSWFKPRVCALFLRRLETCRVVDVSFTRGYAVPLPLRLRLQGAEDAVSSGLRLTQKTPRICMIPTTPHSTSGSVPGMYFGLEEASALP